KVSILFIDAAGNSTGFDPGPFRDVDGTTVVGQLGGVVASANDPALEVLVPEGAVPAGTLVRVESVLPSSMLAVAPVWTAPVAAFRLQMQGVISTKPFGCGSPT